VTSLFFGGGTPSILPPEMIEQILLHVRKLWPLGDAVEITLEANPESTTYAKLKSWRSAGINRLSLGVQALEDHRLALLGRPHDSQQTRRAFAAAREAGFANINLDLIHGSPGHTPEMWEEELGLAMALGPEHLSCYALTVEPGTPLERQLHTHPWTLPDEETTATLHFLTQRLLEDQGWKRYEISNYARSGYACRHNLDIWLSGDYLGVGPAAHGRITLEDGSVIRNHNHWPLETYIYSLKSGQSPCRWVELSSLEEAGADCLLMGLRLMSGIPRHLYRELAGRDLLDGKAKEAEFLVKEGFLQLDAQTIRLSPKGLDFLDSCLASLI